MIAVSGRRARTPLLALAFVFALAVSACATDPEASPANRGDTFGSTSTTEQPAGPPQPGGSLTYGIAAESNSLTPGVGQWAASGVIVANAIYEPLAARRLDGTVEPYLAEAITPNADYTEWTIRVRPGVSFHNGEVFDAAAVVANLEFTRKSALTSAALKSVTAVEAIDPATVRVTMDKPWSTFPNTLAAPTTYMAAPAMLAAPQPGAADPVGTGPFVFRSRRIDSEVVVERNPNYWQPGMPYLDSITFRIIPDDTTRAAAMRAGDLDAMEVNTPTVLAELLQESEAGRSQLLTNAGHEVNEFVIALNTSKPPFDDRLARQAVAAAIDQDELSQILTDGLWPAAWGSFEPGSPFYVTPEEAGYPAPDPARAAQLADQYRDEHGQDLAFTFMINANPLNTRLGQIVQQQLAQAGIAVEIQQVEQARSIGSVLSGDYQAGIFAMFSSPTLDSGYSFIATEPSPTGISLNYTRLHDPEITRAMDAARATGDAEERVTHYEMVQRRMAENLDRIFLYHARSASAFANEVHGFTAATFPGSGERAISADVTYPFYTAMWLEP